MKLIESYLTEVGRYLPEDQREDILSELQQQLEDEVREQSGNTPSRADIEQVLNRYGHPINVASAYQEPRFLIGPELYPAFKETLSTVFVVSVVLVLSLGLLSYVTQGLTVSAGAIIRQTLSFSLWLVGITVASFAALELYGERLGWYDNWKASSLSEQPTQAINRSDLMTNVVTEGVFLLWWNDILTFQNWFPGTEWSIALAPVWSTLYWPLNLIAGAWFVVHVYTLIRRRWVGPTLAGEIFLGSVALVICAYLLVQSPLVEVSGSVKGAELIGRSLKTALLVIGGLTLWDLMQAIRLWRTMPRLPVTT